MHVVCVHIHKINYLRTWKVFITANKYVLYGLMYGLIKGTIIAILQYALSSAKDSYHDEVCHYISLLSLI